MDRRLTPFSGRVALTALQGRIDAPLTAGEAAQVVVPLADLLAKPGGARDRQILLGDAVTVVDRDQGHCFVQTAKDGYCGWLDEAAVGDASPPTHWVSAPATHVYPEPRVQARERIALSLGAKLCVTGTHGTWAETTLGFVPAVHVRRLGDWAGDPVSVAESLIGTPYLWGGNSRAGLDCSGLAQVSLHAAGLDCPGDSDMQQALGAALSDGDALQRSDLLFWKGHVAIVTGPDRLIHSNGHSMSVAYEGIVETIARIASQGGGPVIARRRL
ncbi:NlpC/P60 family protein [Tabrizicola sp. BL-A-41-H6]|uniref:C40 family peptidase n=1 Tax=Tabrizicola sp. BL-A-41-H6 TaxID=3421107 RepID=UPI003D671ECE